MNPMAYPEALTSVILKRRESLVMARILNVQWNKTP